MASKDRMSFDDARSELKITEEELEQLVANGEIAAIKEGDTIFFKVDVVSNFKKNRKTEPTIILADEDMDLLEGVDDLEIGGGASAAREKDDPTPAKAPLAIPDLDDVAIQPRGAGKGAESTSVPSVDDTVLNLEGLLEDDGSEGTTPIPGGEAVAKMVEESADITVEGNVSDETLLDTDLLEIGEEEDSFKLDTTVDETIPDASEANLLRGGGARVMQMKRKKGHPAVTAMLVVSAVLLLVPMGVILNLCDVTKQGEVAGADGGGKAKAGQPYKWITDSNLAGGVFEWIADMF